MAVHKKIICFPNVNSWFLFKGKAYNLRVIPHDYVIFSSMKLGMRVCKTFLSANSDILFTKQLSNLIATEMFLLDHRIIDFTKIINVKKLTYFS